MLLATKLTIISNLRSFKGIKVMKNSTFFEKLCRFGDLGGKVVAGRGGEGDQAISSQTAISIPRYTTTILCKKVLPLAR